jgi:hypothetical protein
MEKYENLGLIGEGSYGMVWKCRNKETGWWAHDPVDIRQTYGQRDTQTEKHSAYILEQTHAHAIGSASTATTDR